MTILEAINARHSVRSYINKPLPNEIVKMLNDEIAACNKDGKLNIQLVTNDKKAFDSMMAHYGKFFGVQNYIALVGKKSDELEEKLGYYGERIALKAQSLGLNTCWVAMSFSKGVVKKEISILPKEKLVCVLALGYGETQGIPHKSKPISELTDCNDENMPEWFKKGIGAAALAPTAMNQQKFLISFDGEKAVFKNLGGFYSKVDLGIVKYNFEIGSGKTFN